MFFESVGIGALIAELFRIEWAISKVCPAHEVNGFWNAFQPELGSLEVCLLSVGDER